MIGAFPPPVHGMAIVNEAVLEEFLESGAKPIVINVSAKNLERSLFKRFGRIRKVLRGLGRLAFSPASQGSTLYMSVSGGLGQVYELAFIVLARLRRMRVFLHHHSFAYIDTPNLLTRVLIRVAGLTVVHIVQSPGMADRMKVLYAAVRVMPVSNVVFLLRRQIPKVERRLQIKTLSFISNIMAEKGIFEFLDLMEVIQAENLPLKGMLAGPFQDLKTERAVRARMDQLKNVVYVGPKYGDKKELFFAGTDVMIFPSSYRNESEAIVNHEAMSRGIPVIAYGRGCIPEIVGPDCGKVIDPREPFVPAALEQIKEWMSEPAAFTAASRAAARRFSDTYIQNEKRWLELLTEMLGGTEINSAKESLKTEAARPN
jgi:glycosyltransferase involved in cell wall biosynthesis